MTYLTVVPGTDAAAAAFEARTAEEEATAAAMVCTIVEVDGRRGFVLGWTSCLGGVFVHGSYLDDFDEDFETDVDEVGR